MSTIQAAAPGQTLRERTSYAVLTMISFLNDMIQSLLPAIYPILKGNFHLDFGQLGLITFTSQLTASVLQPVVGWFPASVTLMLAGFKSRCIMFCA
jgi:MFS transporter, FSR family, fosmidomycin resistance protein